MEIFLSQHEMKKTQSWAWIQLHPVCLWLPAGWRIVTSHCFPVKVLSIRWRVTRIWPISAWPKFLEGWWGKAALGCLATHSTSSAEAGVSSQMSSSWDSLEWNRAMERSHNTYACLCSMFTACLLSRRNGTDAGRNHNKEEGGDDLSFGGKLSRGRILRWRAEVPRNKLTEALQEFV